MCCGCGLEILDRYLLKVNNRTWHPRCLQCSVCRAPLRGHSSCYVKNQEVFCKLDYFRWDESGPPGRAGRRLEEGMPSGGPGSRPWRLPAAKGGVPSVGTWIGAMPAAGGARRKDAVGGGRRIGVLDGCLPWGGG